MPSPLLWLRTQRALVRHQKDAYRALALAHSNNRVLQQRVADLEVELSDALWSNDRRRCAK